MSKKLSLVPAQLGDEWDGLVDRSPQGTLFSESIYIQASGVRHDLFYVMQGEEKKAGVCLVVSDDGNSCVLNDLVIYGGILFDLDLNRAVVKRRHDEFQISEFVIEELCSRYSSIQLTLSPQYFDMRPFLWYAYHDPDPSNRFHLDLRYTSYVNISSLAQCGEDFENAQCFFDMETVRRYSVREAARKEGSVKNGGSADRLIGFYQTLMINQGEEQSVGKLNSMRSIIEALSSKHRGRIYEVMNKDGEVIYAIFYGWDSKRAYYLYGAGHPDKSEPWQGTYAHWEAFKDIAINVGIHEVDMEGVNSPQRGWFKLGFGGNMSAYYQVVRNPRRYENGM
ncbi:MAG: hypothetical protein GC154_08855 [bacterium]|nr:hypothetical protein [bacterium]